MTSENIEATHNKPHVELDAARKCRGKITTEFEEFDKQLTVIITLSGVQTNQDTLTEKQSNIINLPQGQELFNALKKHIESASPTSQVIGIISQQQKKLMGLKSASRYTALINIDVSQHPDTKSLENDIYAHIWKTLSIIDDIKNKNEALIITSGSLTTTKWNDLQTTSRNLFADIFAGSLTELKGQKGAIKNLTKKRCIACFQELQSYEARANPLPIMLETIQMVYDDVCGARREEKSNIKKALNITSEVIDTMDENVIRQWQSFIDAAHEMAWAGLSTAQILGTAIYTSDNVYNRTSAYMIAEILNTDPTPVIKFDGYNAFADLDIQQRSHKIACLETFEYAQSRQTFGTTPETYFQMAHQSCDMLLEGKPNGFCAPALILLGQTVKETPDITKEALSEMFAAQMSAMPWAVVRDLHKSITDLRKNNKCKGLNSIIEVLRLDDETRDAAILIKVLADIIAEKQAANPAQPVSWEDAIG
jgi:hypothetical protein